MTRAAVDLLLYLMDEAFDAPGQEHPLLGNLRAVDEEIWHWVPPGGSRTVRQITAHVAACKFMYDNHAFGDAAMDWLDSIPGLGCGIEDLQSGPTFPNEPPISAVVSWLAAGHDTLRAHVSALNDDDLLTLRKAPWGEMKETRWLIAVMIEHDLYHAGEINHIRALKQANDHWAWEAEERPVV